METSLTKRAGVDRRLPYRLLANSRLEHRTASLKRICFVALVALADLLTIIACFQIIGVTYHAVYLHVGGMAEDFLKEGLLFGSLFLLVNIFRSEYLTHKLILVFSAREIFASWNVTSALALLAEFLLKETGEFSRVSISLFYICGFLSLLTMHRLIQVGLKHYARSGRFRLYRIVLVGSCKEIEDFQSIHQPWNSGIDVAASAILRGCETLADDLALAVALSRIVQPDSIFILSPWTNKDWITLAIDAFQNVPAAIHLGPQPLLTRFKTAGIHRIAGITSLKVVGRPQSLFTSTLKRCLDLAISCIIFTATAPVWALIAIGIKFESKGPIFACDRLVGFNQQTFDAFKFRTTHVEDAPSTSSVSTDRPLTGIGRLLIKMRVERLPRILNVFKGDMSVVGPRPKSLGHSQKSSRLIAAYGRRNNVKPGLTGWAQIHALRSETLSEQAFQSHVEHDLYYVNQQNITLDLQILAHRCFLPAAPDRRRAIVDLASSTARQASRTQIFEKAFGSEAHDVRNILGIDVDDLSFDDALSIGRICLTDTVSRTLFFVNAHTLNQVSTSQVYRRVIEQGHLVFGDGSGVKIAAAMQGIRLRANLNGTDFIPALLASFHEEAMSCYLLGGEQRTVEKASQEIQCLFPNWTVVGHHHGFLNQDTTAAVIADIQAARPDLLLVGMGNPLQEYWITENRDKLSVSLVVGVGALFSYISGDYRRAPQSMRKLGVEWLWVLVMQPHKWRRYIFGNPAFLRRALMHTFQKTFYTKLLKDHRGATK